MAVTSPDSLRTPNPGDPYNLVADLAILAQDTQDALTRRANVFNGTVAQRTAFTSTATDGMLWQDTDGIKMIWRKDSAAWVPAVWRWSGTTAQMNGFTQAPNGFEWFNTTSNTTLVKIGGVWQSSSPSPQYVQVFGVDKALSTSSSQMTWNTTTPQLDTGGFTSSAQNTRLTVPTSGVYRVSYNVRQNGTTTSSSTLLRNGSSISPGGLDSGANGSLGAAVTLGATGLYSLLSGDYLQVSLTSSSAPGGTVWTSGSTFGLELVQAL